jgi:hypothetical protein
MLVCINYRLYTIVLPRATFVVPTPLRTHGLRGNLPLPIIDCRLRYTLPILFLYCSTVSLSALLRTVGSYYVLTSLRSYYGVKVRRLPSKKQYERSQLDSND